jgi:hypothetical protein
MAVWVRTVSVYVEGDVRTPKEADLVVEEANKRTMWDNTKLVEIVLPDDDSGYNWERVE